MANTRKPRDMQYISENVSVDAVTGCWIWTGPVIGDKRWPTPAIGRTKVRDLVFDKEHGELIEGLIAVPICGNLLCVSPQHLDARLPQTLDERRAKSSASLRGKASCKNGHDREVHGFINSAGRKECRLCSLNVKKARRNRQRAAGLPVT